MGRSKAELTTLIQTAVSPVKERYDYYVQGEQRIRGLIKAYFFKPEHQHYFTAIVSLTTGVSMDSSIDGAFLDDSFPSTEALDNVLIQAQLGIKVNAQGLYQTDYGQAVLGETKIFMDKLACAMSVLRIAKLIQDTYLLLFNSRYLDGQGLIEAEQRIDGLVALFDSSEEKDFQFFYQAILQAQSASRLLYNGVHDFKQELLEATPQMAAKILTYLDTIGKHLVSAYSSFHDQTWLGDGWAPLVRELTKIIFANQYTYTYIMAGAITINPDFLAAIGTELAKADQVFNEHFLAYKLAYLAEIQGKEHGLLVRVQAEAALAYVVLEEQKVVLEPRHGGLATNPYAMYYPGNFAGFSSTASYNSLEPGA